MKKIKKISLVLTLLGVMALGITYGFKAQAFECEGCRPNIYYVCCEGVWGDDEGHIFAYEIPGRKFLIKT